MMPMNGKTRRARSTCSKGKTPAKRVRKILQAVTACLSVIFYLIPLSVLPAELYKWVDESGNIHFSDKPATPAAEKITVKTPSQGDHQYQLQMQEQEKILRILTDERLEKSNEAEAGKAQARLRESNCAAARQQLANIQDSSYLYEPTEDPLNPRILDTNERQAVTRQATDQVRQWCQ